MTKIEFLLLADNAQPSDVYNIIYQRTRFASEQGGVYIHTQNETESRALDTHLSAIQPDVPVSYKVTENLAPEGRQVVIGIDDAKIFIGSQCEPDGSHSTLVSTSVDIPWFFSRFDYFIELVQAGEKARTMGRERYLYYKRRGYPLQHKQL